ncbi:hypothetical protein SAMD00019534_063280 [Acytostelium subglobosum LB1]|uniref:hypothetical protein n=1 Tax=Acytostelium subglobosum LB1 TaxID=1410327 RepID=UPI000644F273|nr:hypothetical protein SAMD00019534_063280 [Acytostelium subglobosum LB1]GAM23153.1 hypothetical protein SAMD00019534_063280 [Acytostelium subglobosum LB1]|eukprot:XP_012753602.1 hypothetical protein SAMD00019534_063280 [Acytostelium subglobosum LB1]
MSDNDSVDQVVQEFGEVKEEIQEKVHEEVEKAKEVVKEAVETVHVTAEKVSEKVSEKIQEVRSEIKAGGCCPYSASGEYSICHQTAKICNAMKSFPCHDCCNKVLLWEDLVQTGLLFVIGNLVFLLLCCFKYSLLSLVSYTAMVATVVSMLFNVVSILLNKYAINLDNPVTDRLKTLSFHIDQAVVEKYVKGITELINAILSIAKDVLSCKSLILSAQFALAFFVLATIGKCCSGLGLLYTVFLIAFIAPRLYLEKKQLIDEQLVKVKAIGQEIINKLHPYINMVCGHAAPATPASSSSSSSTTAKPTKKTN